MIRRLFKLPVCGSKSAVLDCSAANLSEGSRTSTFRELNIFERAAFAYSGIDDDSLRALGLAVGSFLKRNTLIVLKDLSGTRSLIDIKMLDSIEHESSFSTSYLISAMACSTNDSMN